MTTYAELKQNIKDFMEDDGTEFSNEIDKFDDWEDLAELSFKKRFPDGVSEDFQKLQKQKNFLSNKGFTFYQIESVLD